MELSDPELMARLAEGDDLALNAIMERWGSRVAAYLHRMTGSRESGVDLAQETFVKLYQSRHRYRTKGSFSSYLFTIASNLARNHARWRSRHPTVSLDAADGRADPVRAVPEAVDTCPTPAEAAAGAEVTAAVLRALGELPDALREAMCFFIYEGMGYSEIAAFSGCSAKAAETRIYRARQLMKEKLKHLLE